MGKINEYAPEILARIAIDFERKEVVAQAEELRILNQTLINILDSVGMVDVKKIHRVYIEAFAKKIIYHSLSIVYLSKGLILNSKQKDFTIIDASSSYVLTRTLIETYITFHYIYVQPKTEEEQFFRFKLWQISGFLTRQTLTPLSGTTYKEEEKAIIDKLKIALESDPYYDTLTRDQKKTLERHGLPRIKSWKELIKECGFNEMLVNGYSHFSQYAHSEFFAMQQIKHDNYRIDFFDRPDRQDIFLCLRLGQVLISRTITDLVSLLPEAKVLYDVLPIIVAAKIDFMATLDEREGKE